MGRPIKKKFFFSSTGTDSPPSSIVAGVSSITVKTSGTNYSTTTGVTVVLSAPQVPAPIGVQAVATATVSAIGTISTITVVTAGSGYESPPSISLANVGTGTGATFLINMTAPPAGPSGTFKPSAFIPGGTTASTADILQQISSRAYFVQTSDGFGRCVLAATGTSFLTAGQMNLSAVDFNGSTYWIKKLTSRKALVYQSTSTGSGFLVGNGVLTAWTTGTATGTIVGITTY